MLARGSRLTKKGNFAALRRTSCQHLRRSRLQKSSTYCSEYASGFLEPAALHLRQLVRLANGSWRNRVVAM